MVGLAKKISSLAQIVACTETKQSSYPRLLQQLQYVVIYYYVMNYHFSFAKETGEDS